MARMAAPRHVAAACPQPGCSIARRRRVLLIRINRGGGHLDVALISFARRVDSL
jgi:hypothetical protein